MWLSITETGGNAVDSRIRLKYAGANYASYLGDIGGDGNDPSLQQGDSIRVVWTASSGGKTQTLYKYSVQ
jgi:hypothetical protein